MIQAAVLIVGLLWLARRIFRQPPGPPGVVGGVINSPVLIHLLKEQRPCL